MALTVDTDTVARTVFGIDYGSASTPQSEEIDNAIAFAKIRVLNFSQFFTGDLDDAGSPSQPATVWNHWATMEAAVLTATKLRREILNELVPLRNEALELAINTTTTTSPEAATVTGATVTLAWLRRYIAIRCVKRRQRVWPNVDIVDGAINKALTDLWNRHAWHFKQREVIFTIATNGTVTDDLATGEEVDSLATRELVYRDDTSLKLRWTTREDMTLRRADQVDSSLAVTAADTGAETFTVAGDKTHLFPSGRSFTVAGSTGNDGTWYVSSSSYSSGSDATTITVTGDVTDATADGTITVAGYDTGRPDYFRWEGFGSAATWVFYPFPDSEYRVMGWCYLKGPTLPDSLSDADEINLFPHEFRPFIADFGLAYTLKDLDSPDWQQQVTDAENRLAPLLQETDNRGVQDDDLGVLDIYNDFDRSVATQRNFERYGDSH